MTQGLRLSSLASRLQLSLEKVRALNTLVSAKEAVVLMRKDRPEISWERITWKLERGTSLICLCRYVVPYLVVHDTRLSASILRDQKAPMRILFSKTVVV